MLLFSTSLYPILSAATGLRMDDKLPLGLKGLMLALEWKKIKESIDKLGLEE